MSNSFTAILERDGDWYIAYCPEIPGANGQGRSRDDALASLAEAIDLILEDRRADCDLEDDPLYQAEAVGSSSDGLSAEAHDWTLYEGQGVHD